jgi:hypothetical protein
MATNRDLLKEAIAEAKAVKEMAIANAKAALEEAFTPQLKSMLATKLQEMEEEDLEEAGFGKMSSDATEGFSDMEEKALDEEETTEELDLDELLAELEEAEDDDMMYEAEEAEEDMMDEEEAESLDLEDMSEEDLKSFIEDVIADMIEAGELEAGESEEGEEMEDEEMEDEMEEEDEEVNIDELLAEIDSMDEEEEMMEEGLMDKIVKAVNRFGSSGRIEDLKKEIPAKVAAGKKLAASGKIESFTEPTEADINTIVKAAEEDGGTGRVEIKGGKLVYTPGSEAKGAAQASTFENLQKELSEAHKTIQTLRSELNEVNLLNAKLLYTNKIFKGKNLTESQKVKVLETFDKATTVKEVKLVYETLNEGINTNKRPISENLGSASKAMGTTKKPIIEANDQFARMRELAFYSTKH